MAGPIAALVGVGEDRDLHELTRGSVPQLDPQLANWLRLCPLDNAETGSEPTRQLAVSLSDIRQFLECPLQGWARLALRLREDEDEEEDLREDEHFVTGRLRETGLLRQAFLTAIQQERRGDRARPRSSPSTIRLIDDSGPPRPRAGRPLRRGRAAPASRLLGRLASRRPASRSC